MDVAAAIGAHGFRRWYERQLVEAFAYMTTGVLSLIMTGVAVEMIEFRRSAAGLLALVTIVVAGGALCVFAWRRFHLVLSRAEYLAEQAVCPGCGVYAKFELTATREAPAAPAGCTLDARCRRCGRAWRIG